MKQMRYIGCKDMVFYKTDEFKFALSLIVFSALYVLLSAFPAFAITAPAAGSFAHDIYKVAVQDILKGPIGFVGGVGCVVIGAIAAVQSKIMAAVPAVLGGASIIKADSITSSLGALF